MSSPLSSSSSLPPSPHQMFGSSTTPSHIHLFPVSQPLSPTSTFQHLFITRQHSETGILLRDYAISPTGSISEEFLFYVIMTASTRSEDFNRTASGRHCWSRKSSNEPNNCPQRRRLGVKGNNMYPVGHMATRESLLARRLSFYRTLEKESVFGMIEPHRKS